MGTVRRNIGKYCQTINHTVHTAVQLAQIEDKINHSVCTHSSTIKRSNWEMLHIIIQQSINKATNTIREQRPSKT